MRYRNVLIIILLLFIFTNCGEGSGSRHDSTGPGSEIIVITRKAIWDGPVGDTIRAGLMPYLDGMPESETMFTLIFIPENNFSKYLQSHHNILFIDINPAYTKSKVETLKNTWAQPQRVIKIKAGSDSACINLAVKHAAAIRELFNQCERARYSVANKVNRNTAIEKTLADDFGIKMTIPKDFYKAKQTSEFIWLRHETNTYSIGLLIYTVPYIDSSQTSPTALLDLRDKITRQHIPGPADGSYMTLERNIIPPVTTKILFKDLYALESRGLWRTEGDFMGGPFINYSIVDSPRHRIVVFDGYVYYPNKSKRNYIRQLESIIWEAQFVNFSKKD